MAPVRKGVVLPRHIQFMGMDFESGQDISSHLLCQRRGLLGAFRRQDRLPEEICVLLRISSQFSPSISVSQNSVIRLVSRRVSQDSVPGGIRGSRYIRPDIGKPLEPLAFQRCQPPYELGQFRGAFLSDCPCGGLPCRLTDKVSGPYTAARFPWKQCLPFESGLSAAG